MIARRFLALVCAHNQRLGRSPADNDRLAISSTDRSGCFSGLFAALDYAGGPC